MLRLLLACLIVPALAHADEGMWTFDGFPADRVRAAYGAAPDQAWLDHVRNASLRLARGCSASIISADGLVMTNHHCARGCTSALSDGSHDFVRDGFLAATEAGERRCPDVEADRLASITDVTDDIHQATEGKNGREFADAELAAESRLTAGCGTDAAVRCDVVKLYEGGKYALYRYDRYQDLRLVWSPEDQAANFGGDPDNFEFPRYALDAAFLRIYVDGKPFAAPDHLHLSAEPLHEGDVVFTSGNPGRTERDDTVDQLIFARDVTLPRLMADLSERGGVMQHYASTSPEHLRTALNDVFFVANAVKAISGQHTALANASLLDGKRKAEAMSRDRIAQNLNLRDAAGAWDAIAQATQQARVSDARYWALVGYPRFLGGELLDVATGLVRAAAERAKPDAERLRGYSEAEMPALRERLLSTAPIYPELEALKLSTLLVKMRQLLGADDPAIHAILRTDAPETLADTLTRETHLLDVSTRQKLFDGGAQAIAASDDPLIVFARDRFDAPSRAAIAEHEALEATMTRAATSIAHAKFTLDGTTSAPDATFSPRVSFGTVSGYPSRGEAVAPFTNWAGAFGRQTGAYPFTLPPSWNAAMDALTPYDELDVATTNDITGGNSGSPLIGMDSQAVGLIFDGNREALADTYAYPGAFGGRAVAVTSVAIREALSKIYHADRLVTELDR